MTGIAQEQYFNNKVHLQLITTRLYFRFMHKFPILFIYLSQRKMAQVS